jgi:hypothetical protein
MNHTTDELSKNLAGGMSRRKAFLKFLGGAGALGFLGLRKAKAGNSGKYPALPPTVAGCLNFAGIVYDECLFFGGNYNCCFEELTIAYDYCFEACEHRKL